ncbi:MAG: helix-turn-helix domain-containing protein [Candidatus Moranbacteria bacterium]|nr:helix-turn-helix domain-containing protein [Candidatus Moranbacteria bacterium]
MPLSHIQQLKKDDHAACPVAKVADLVGDTWSLLIVRDLLKTRKRFGALAESLVGISTRTLTDKLRKLEQEGIVKRTVFHEKPLRVEYTLTKKGDALCGVIDAMRAFGEEYG